MILLCFDTVEKYGSSREEVTKSHLRRSYQKWRHRPLPEVTYVMWPEVTSPVVTCPEEDRPGTGSDRVRMRNQYILCYYYSSTKCSTVEQVPWLPEVTEGVPLGACMSYRKLRNIRPSGSFWPEGTSPKVTSWTVGLPLDFSYIFSLWRPRLSFSNNIAKTNN